MTDVMASLFVDDEQSKAKLTLFRDGNCCLIASMVTTYSLQQMLLSVVVDGSTKWSCNAFYNRRSSRFDIAFHGIWAETDPKMRLWFHVSWWNSEVSKSLAASLECYVCNFGQFGLTSMSNMIFLCQLTIVTPRLPCLFRKANDIS